MVKHRMQVGKVVMRNQWFERIVLRIFSEFLCSEIFGIANAAKRNALNGGIAREGLLGSKLTILEKLFYFDRVF